MAVFFDYAIADEVRERIIFAVSGVDWEHSCRLT